MIIAPYFIEAWKDSKGNYRHTIVLDICYLDNCLEISAKKGTTIGVFKIYPKNI